MKKFIAMCIIATMTTATVQAASVNLTKGTGAGDPVGSDTGDFIAGSGITSDGFAVANYGSDGGQLAIKPRGRISGQPLSRVGNQFFLEPGLAAAPKATKTWWTFDFQFNPGMVQLDPEDFILKLEMDFDPSPTATSFVTFDWPVGDPGGLVTSWDDTDGFFTNPSGDKWSNNNVPFVISQSWNYTFFPFGLPAYDVNASGTYDLILTVSSATTELASVAVQAVVIPLPTASLAGVFGFGLMSVMRRKRKA